MTSDHFFVIIYIIIIVTERDRREGCIQRVPEAEKGWHLRRYLALQSYFLRRESSRLNRVEPRKSTFRP